MDVFLLDGDNVVPVPWLYVHSLHTRIPKLELLKYLQISFQYFDRFKIIRKNNIVLLKQLTFDRLCLYS